MMLDELNCMLFVYTAIISCQNKSDKKAVHNVRKFPFFSEILAKCRGLISFHKSLVYA